MAAEEGEPGNVRGNIEGIVVTSANLWLGAKSISVKTVQSIGHKPECLKAEIMVLSVTYPSWT